MFTKLLYVFKDQKRYYYVILRYFWLILFVLWTLIIHMHANWFIADFSFIPYFSGHLYLVTFEQTWAQDTFKISSSRPSSNFYIQDKNQVLRSLKNTSSSENLQFHESLSKQSENPAIQALSKKTKIVEVLILLAGWI